MNTGICNSKINLYKALALAFCIMLLFINDASAGWLSEIVVTAPGSGSGGAIFTTMATSTAKFAQGFRKIAFVLSAFGLIMFTFMAICGKINFKHLGYIVICLFFLSGTAALITYLTGVEASLPTEFRNGDTYMKASSI